MRHQPKPNASVRARVSTQWYLGCPLEFVVFPTVPFVNKPGTPMPARRQGIDELNQGFAMRVLGNVTARLLWKPLITYLDSNTYDLGPP